MVDVGNFKATMKIACAGVWTEDSRVHAEFRAVRERLLAKDISISILDRTVVS